jgi:glycosyltransferase involved in cell wall biosynthesis
MTTLHVVVPDGIHDPARPSGGNSYDRRICRELAATGWQVREHAIPGSWPWPAAAAEQAVTRTVEGLRDGGLVLLDGLIASAIPAALVPHADRLRLVVLVHLPLGYGAPGHAVTDAPDRERVALSAARAVIATSRWTRQWLLANYPLRPDAVHTAAPGADTAPLARGTADGGELLCVAAVTPAKGHEVLLTALSAIADLPWRCSLVGRLDRDPQFVDRLHRAANTSEFADRIWFRGPLGSDELGCAYAGADALVLASAFETYGMVVTEALGFGLPVIATAVGGLPDALGTTIDGQRPGLLVPPDDPSALAAALATWLGDAELRQRLRSAARERRRTLPTWTTTAERIAQVLSKVAA